MFHGELVSAQAPFQFNRRTRFSPLQKPCEIHRFFAVMAAKQIFFWMPVL
jgi:hypothetical protein